MPFGYTRSLLMPSGSIKIWWLFLSPNLKTLSSIEGQYLGPMPEMLPEYIADKCMFFLIMSWVFLLVLVIKHETCCRCFSCCLDIAIHGVGVSPFCSSITSRSKLDIFILAGVPVFNLPIGNFRSYSFLDRGIAEASPVRPPIIFSCPVYITPFKKVPVVSIVFFPLTSVVLFITTP